MSDEVVRTWNNKLGVVKTVDPAAAIATAAGRDHLCEQTMQLFVLAYGAEAGNRPQTPTLWWLRWRHRSKFYR